ncbi:MAG: hypothetical protein OEZ01_09560, partial [Candidatus Heimdallarchaeota archaeon]|nr:hypothetical protein [Candidatus Heimdallarchaeota archaeon]
MTDKKFFFWIILMILIPISISTVLLQINDLKQSSINIEQNEQDEPIIPSTPTDVYIVEEATYDAPVGNNRPIVHLHSILYWEDLADITLFYFINTSDIISVQFRDYESKVEMPINDKCDDSFPPSGNFENDFPAKGTLNDYCDRYWISPASRSFESFISAYYDPDIIEDTGFIVIFNSQSVDFELEVDGESVYAKVDYRNKITLPEGAGIVSYAPIDEGVFPLEYTDGRYSITWEYKHRAMDSKHDPLMIEVTYSFDEIWLAFTNQVYQNQLENQRRQEEENRLNQLR